MENLTAQLVSALENALEALRNIAPHLISNDCFNSGINFDGPCPCSLCRGKRALDAARSVTV